MTMPFNRTIVELKQGVLRARINGYNLSFNRTIVELKQNLKTKTLTERGLLIEPLWN